MNIVCTILLIPDAVSGHLFVDPQRNGEYRFARSYVSDGMVVLDVGANIKRSGHSMVEILDLLAGLNRFSFYRLTFWAKWPIGRISFRLDDYKQINYLANLDPIRIVAR